MSTSTFSGQVSKIMQAEARAVSDGLRRAVTRAGQEVQTLLRDQARGTGFKDGGRALANAWRLKAFPTANVMTFHPAALVMSKTPEIVNAFDQGQPITVKRHKYMAFPTGFNAIGGRRNASRRGGLRVSTSEMLAAKGQAFVIPSKKNRLAALWCLRVKEARGLKKSGKNRVRLFVGDAVEVMTGHRKGQQQAARETLARGFVPMFILVRQVNPRKRLDVDAVRDRADSMLMANVLVELSQI